MRRFYKSRDRKLIAGVCGGLGEFFSINPWIVRIGFIALFLFLVIPVLIVYFMLWMILPAGPDESPPPPPE